MMRLKVVIVGSTPAETLQIEEALQQTGCLDSFRYLGLEQAQERVPNWESWDLVLARYQEKTGPELLGLLAPVLRGLTPRVIFLVDPYDPLLVTRMLNAGASNVLPVNGLDAVLESSLSAVFGGEWLRRRALAMPVTQMRFASPLKTQITPPAHPADEFLSVEDGFARLFRSSPIGLGIHRLRDGVCLDCNESFARMLESTRDEIIGSTLLELGPLEDIRAKLHQASLIPGTVVQFERNIFTRSRQVLRTQVMLDQVEWGGEACFLSMVQDITEKSHAKEKIRKLNDELEKTVLVRTGALEAANRELAAEISRRKYLEDFSHRLNQVIWETTDVVSIYDASGAMLFLNKAGRDLFGLGENDSVAHLDMYYGYGDEAREQVKNEIQPYAMRYGMWRGEVSYDLEDGRSIPLSQVMLCERESDGVVLYFATISRDISDFKRVEKMLRESRERYRTLAEAARDLIFVVSTDGKMEYANGNACKALGIDPQMVEGMAAADFFPQDFAANHLQMFYEVHEIDQPVYTEGPFVRDGEQFWLGTWLVPIHDERQGLSSILGVSRDITEQKKTDEALQRALQNERSLSEMRANFFSMTSHQFRTPLTTILLSSEVLLKYAAKLDDNQRGEHLGRIQEAANRLNGMLEDILVIGRVESGRYVCTPKSFDLITFCQQCVHEMAINDRALHKITFMHDGIEQLMILHDPEVVHRVVDNLLSNAIKYSPADSQVTLRVKMEESNVLLEVADQGIGIPDRDLKYLFQPFQRGSNAGKIPGTGIGLTIIQKSVELMRGTVALKSTEGQGSTFMVRFPARMEDNPPPSGLDHV